MFDEKKGSIKDAKNLMKNHLQKGQMTLLDSIAQIADHEGVNVYVAGGFVRDLLLNIQNLDIDLVVEGNGIDFADTLARQLNGLAKCHARFGTSVVTINDQSRIDVAMARIEYYSHPGALPKVERSSIEKDLSRRDFTINSMAIKLNGEKAFSLFDFFNSQMDLKAGLIRVLHDRSFIEDPCRIFRAIRFEKRFDFRIEAQTRALMKSAIESNLINKLSKTRLMKEVKLIFQEPDPAGCVDRMREFSILQFFAPDLSNDDSHWLIMKEISGVLTWTKMVPMPKKPEIWFVYFHGFFIEMKDFAFEQAIKRLKFPAKISNRMRADREHIFKAKRDLNKGRELKPSKIYDVFSGLSSEAVILLLATCSSEQVKRYAALYFNQYYASAKTKLTGDDLLEMGMKPGPIFDEVFKAIRDARINGQVSSRDEEVILVKAQFLK